MYFYKYNCYRNVTKLGTKRGLGSWRTLAEHEPMLALDQVDRATFTPHLGETFEAIFTDGRLPFTLAEVRPLGAARPGASREPFALTFHAPPKHRFPQHTYRLEHPILGAMELFLVQVGVDAKAAHLEAVFS